MTTPIKVLHVANDYPPGAGGAAIRMKSFMEPLAELDDIEVHVLTVRSESAKESENYEFIGGVHVNRVSSQKALPAAIYRLSRKHDIQIVHAHNARYALFAEVARLPIFLELHALDNIKGIKGQLLRLACWRARRLFTLAKAASKKLSEMFNIPESKLDELCNGVDLRMFNSTTYSGVERRQSLGISVDDFVIGYAGTFYDWQGVDLLIRGFSEAIQRGLVNAKLLLVGSGTSFDENQETCRLLGIEEYVHFTGRVPFQEVPDHMSAMDVFALARPDTNAAATAVPLKVLEAMAMQRCVLVTPVKGLLEVVEHGVNGYCVEGFTADKIAEGILELADNPTMRTQLGTSASQWIESYHSWEKVANKLANMYRDFLATE